jgi:hypothetical protein
VRITLPIALVVASAGISTHALPEAAIRKDKAALMLYGGLVDAPVLID